MIYTHFRARFRRLLVDTVIFMTGLYFALRSGDEHWQLRFEPCQIELVEQSGERPHLVYTEDISKNRPGGLKGRKMKPKVVMHHANEENPDRCFVRVFKLYNSLCPENRPKNAFYLKPLQKPKPGCRFSAKPLGRNTLEETVARFCNDAAISGFKTNHSLRATTATRLYQAGVDEQLVMERTGHRSLGVRSYKRTSQLQQESLPGILNGSSPASSTAVVPYPSELQATPSTSDSFKQDSQYQVPSQQTTVQSTLTKISHQFLTFIHVQ